ncbi:MAG: hypothetical protein PF694_00920 [Bacteroidetes bacterium]|nr:hypothetical protein [Bacteroidota bacterium]
MRRILQRILPAVTAFMARTNPVNGQYKHTPATFQDISIFDF